MAPSSLNPPASRLHRCRYFVFAVSVFLLLLYPATTALAFGGPQDSKAILLGYGQSIPGWGQTTERVQTIDFIPRYSLMMDDNVGSGLLQGKYTTLFELPIQLVRSPVVTSMIGINFLACYTFTSSAQWRPYIFGGGGPVYSSGDIPGMGTRFNGNYQFALGLDHPITTTQSLLFEIRYHHISNAGTAEPNVPLNSIKFLIGLTF